MTKYSAYYSDENKPVARICRDRNSVQIGDLIQFRNNADIWYKLAIITEIKNSEIYYVQHSPNCLEHRLSEDNVKEFRFICAKNWNMNTVYHHFLIYREYNDNRNSIYD